MKTNEEQDVGIIVAITCVILTIIFSTGIYVHFRDQDKRYEHCVVSESYDYVELLICLK